LPEENANRSDERHAYAHALARQIRDRADYLTDRAQNDAAAGRGWAVDYGSEPDELADAVAWSDRIAAAAAFRDFADYTGGDATGPARRRTSRCSAGFGARPSNSRTTPPPP
jgi:hypothetical protein